MTDRDVAGRPFNQLKNYVWSQLGQIALYEILVRESFDAARNTVNRLDWANCTSFPNIALFALLLWALMVFICFNTRFGRYMYVIGGGEAVAKTSGVPVTRYKVYAFMLSGALAGIAGTLAVARVGAAGPTLGTDLLLNSLAAIVVGGTSLSGGVGGVHRSLLGVLIITILDDGLNLLGVNQYMQMVIKGAVVTTAVLISQDRSKIRIIK
jgi:ribose transport system permease protein